MFRFVTAATAAMLLAFAGTFPVLCADFQVMMLNRGEAGAMVFEPALTEIAVGDTVTFVPTNPGHNAETIPGMLPEGAEAFKGGIGKEISVTFTVAGAYGVKCLPHLAMGMVALIVVGDEPPANLEEVKAVSVPPLAARRFEAIFAELESAE